MRLILADRAARDFRQPAGYSSVSLKGETKLRGFIGQLAHLRPESAGRYGDVAGAEAEAVRPIGESFLSFPLLDHRRQSKESRLELGLCFSD
jgi:hypothetical protein